MKLFKRFGPLVIFVFALTPLPDDLIFIPLGVMRYKIINAFIPALLGKFTSNLIVAYAGRLSIGIIGDFFGVEGEGASLLIGTVLAVILLVVVLVVMFKVDWEKRAEKYLDETEKNIRRTTEKKTQIGQMITFNACWTQDNLVVLSGSNERWQRKPRFWVSSAACVKAHTTRR
jgi:uncharacterized membrane protein